MFSSIRSTLTLASLSLLLLGCASQPATDDIGQLTAQALKNSFRDQGQAKIDRLQQDEANRVCSESDAKGEILPVALARPIEQANAATVRPPTDGKYLGDWREGEKIAQNGRGLTWTDAAGSVNGGNCYNCHEITKAEVSFGTIGPSLLGYGKRMGTTADMNSARAQAAITKTWTKLWNARASNACSQMPRFGHKAILTEAQIKDVMALLLDPKSPVNQ